MNEIFDELDKQAYMNLHLRGVLITLTKDHPIQAHDYMMIEHPDFKGKILDIGSGPGVLAIVSKLKNPELDITIMDGSKIVLEIAQTLAYNAGLKNFIPAIQGVIGSIMPEELLHTYDTIVMNHVVEHVEDLDMLFEWVKCLLKENGTIFIAVPFRDCHYSPHHKHFFDIKDGEKGFFNKEHVCTNIVPYLQKHNLDGTIEIFDEEKKDKRHPHKSRGQLDMVLILKEKK